MFIQNGLNHGGEENRFLDGEDLFFSFCANLSELDFHVPDFLTALDFSVEWDIGHAYQRMPEWLPFGVHAWYPIGYQHWKLLIENSDILCRIYGESVTRMGECR